MAKIILATPDVTALLAAHPDLEIELAAKAVTQLSETLCRKITKASVTERVDKCIAAVILERTTAQGGGKLSAEFSAVMHTQAKACVTEAFATGVSSVVRTIIREEVRLLMPSMVQELTKEVRTELRQMMKDELVQMLLSGDK